MLIRSTFTSMSFGRWNSRSAAIIRRSAGVPSAQRSYLSWYRAIGSGAARLASNAASVNSVRSSSSKRQRRQLA